MFELGFLACLWPNVSSTCITSFMIEYLKPIYLYGIWIGAMQL